jgi:hypothetical protein
MASARFKQDDFLAWDKSDDKTIEFDLRSQLKALSKDLLEYLPSFEIQPLHIGRDYIVTNIYDPKYNQKPQQIPHWSLGL